VRYCSFEFVHTGTHSDKDGGLNGFHIKSELDGELNYVSLSVGIIKGSHYLCSEARPKIQLLDEQ